MKNIRILLAMLLVVSIFSCQKEEPEQLQDVVFDISQIFPVNQRDGSPAPYDFKCQVDKDGNLLEPTIAEIVIDGVSYFPKVFYLDGKLYTQAFKLPVKDSPYTITKFVLLDEMGGKVIMAVPEFESKFAPYVTITVPFEITVHAFKKVEIPIEVLCYIPEYFKEFGFFWFNVGEIVVRNFCFFGDICIKNPEIYKGSWYDGMPGHPLQLDMPAIMKIVVKRKTGTEIIEVPGSPFSNVKVEGGVVTYFTNKPLCVPYPDRLHIPGEIFFFELYVYLNLGNGFGWVKMDTYQSMDDGVLKTMEGIVIEDLKKDGVYDFVVGTCNYTPADIEFAPWQALPEKAKATIAYTPYSIGGGYHKFYINSLTPAGTKYDFPKAASGIYRSWCGSKETISNGTWDFWVYSSLRKTTQYGTVWPTGTPATLQQLARVNWLFSNLKDFGYPPLTEMFVTEAYTISEVQARDLQHAIWLIMGLDPNTIPVGSGGGTPSALAIDMKVKSGAHEDFLPLPGQYAAVLLIKSNDPTEYQLLLTMVDP